MKVKDAMSKDVSWATEDTTVLEIAKKMREHKIGCVPVRENANSAVIGIITDRDITIRIVAQGHNPMTATAGEIMSKDIHYCYEDEDLRRAAEKMEEFRVRRLPVYDKDDHMVGLISLADLSAYSSFALTGEVLGAIADNIQH